MDHKKSPIRRTKRQAKVLEDNYWDCSVCTYRNTAEAFKCLMCDVRKGTSTRKPRINPQLVAQQVAQQYVATPAASGGGAAPLAVQAAAGVSRGGQRSKGGKAAARRRHHTPRLKNVDRSSAQTREVTVNSVTVVITEYKPKAPRLADTTSSSEHSESSTDAAR